MAAGNPIITFTVTRFHRKGMISEQQRDDLIAQGRQLNAVIWVGIIVLVIACFMTKVV